MIPPRPVRRLLLPLLIALELAVLVVAIVAAIAGVLLVLVDRRARVLRLAAMASHYVVIEFVTLAALAGVWLWSPVGGAVWAGATELRLVTWALGQVLAAGRRWTGFRVEIEEPPDLAPFDRDDPVLVLSRHGGIGDSFTVAWVLAHCYGRRPRVVLKNLLLLEPLLDVALSRMGACWVPGRASTDRQRLVGEAAATLTARDALLLFPEGENWTPKRRLKGMARLWRSGRVHGLRASALMEHVLAPRPGGVLASLEARPDLPVVVMAHTGLDRVTSAGELWGALPFRAPMRLRWWLAAPVPDGEEARVEWLTAEWAVVDQWIDAKRGG